MKKLYVIAAALLIVAAAGLVFQMSGTSEELSRYNSEWNGTSGFFSGISHSELVFDYDSLVSKTNSTLLIIGPVNNFYTDELYTYLSRGNTIVIADQSGNANPFLKLIGSTITVHGETLCSTDKEYNDPGIFKAYPLEDIFGAKVDSVVFNYPGYLTGGKSLIDTSPLSWVDKNKNGVADKNETLKSYSVAATDNISKGRIIVVSDPSLFTNSMQNRLHANNMAILSALKAGDLSVDQVSSKTTNGGGLFGLLNLIYRFPITGAAILAVLFLVAGVIFIARYYKK